MPEKASKNVQNPIPIKQDMRVNESTAKLFLPIFKAYLPRNGWREVAVLPK